MSVYYNYCFLGEYSDSAISKIHNYINQKSYRNIQGRVSAPPNNTYREIYDFYTNYINSLYISCKNNIISNLQRIIVYGDEEDPCGENAILREVISKFKEKHGGLYIYSFSELCSMDADFEITALEKQPVIERNDDPVSKPSHYVEGRKYEPRKVIYDWGLNFNLGNAVKYISRAGRKNPDKKKEDLEKAIQYIKFELKEMEDEHERD